MRIWHQSMASLESLGAYGAALERRLPGLVSPGTEVVIHGVPQESYAGLPPAAVLRYPYAKYLIHDQALGYVARAEREGYDAVAFATFAEPLLQQARSIVDIPVTSMLEASLLVGCSLARRIALVTLAPENRVRLTEQVERHALGQRIAGIYPLDPPVTEFVLAAAFDEPQGVIDAFSQTARRAIADGCDLVIPAEGVFTEVLAAQKIDRIDGAAVMDCVAVVMAYTEMMVRLRQRTGLGVGRRWDHARPPAELMDRLAGFFGSP
ncbi:MAG TPA: aspartate/glutamate racemase family protein [Novosphingobium sp.]